MVFCVCVVWSYGVNLLGVVYSLKGPLVGLSKVALGCDKSLTMDPSDVCVFTKMPS